VEDVEFVGLVIAVVLVDSTVDDAEFDVTVGVVVLVCSVLVDWAVEDVNVLVDSAVEDIVVLVDSVVDDVESEVTVVVVVWDPTVKSSCF
jgi:hypothetical protein